MSSGHLYLGGDQLNTHPLIVEDCTVVYARSRFATNSGGCLFNMRATGGGSGGDTVTFRDDLEDNHIIFQVVSQLKN